MQAFICAHQAAPLTLELLSLAWCSAAATMWMRAAPTTCRCGPGGEFVRSSCSRGVTHVVASGRTLKVTLLDGEVALYSSRHERMEERRV